MNCNDVATIMDEHSQSRLTTSERYLLDEHLAGCEACSLSWHAQSALLALPIPATPRSLLGDVLSATATRRREIRPAPRRRRTRTALSIAVLAAGAAVAAAAVVTVVQRARDDWATAFSGTATPAGPAGTRSTEQGGTSANAAADTLTAGTKPVERVNVDYLPVVPVVRTRPDYPLEALKRKLEGWVQLRFTIGANGAVEDATVVDSDEPLFEAAALRALSGWKYLPRVLAGKRVPVPDQQTIIRFALAANPPASAGAKANNAPARQTPQASDDAAAAARYASILDIERWIAIAWERVSAEDFRGAELELDELRATYDLDAQQQGGLLDFYGYIFTQYGDYGRAIAAYESAIAIYDTLPRGGGGQWRALADLYFARHQYDMALKTVVAYRNKAGGNPQRTGTDEFIEKLRALGVTEETLTR